MILANVVLNFLTLAAGFILILFTWAVVHDVLKHKDTPFAVYPWIIGCGLWLIARAIG